MFVPRSQSPPRQGVILLVVVLMLTLFMVVGISFVLYAESEATASRYYREAQFPSDIADIPPEVLLSYGLGQLIYDVPDDSGSAFSAMRGHSLARTMYGWHYRPTNNGPYNATNAMQVDATKTNSMASLPLEANNMPYNGIGPLRGQTLLGSNEYEMVNYTWFPTDGFVRDPERPGTRTSADAPLNPYAGGFNAPYTYLDRNSMFVTAVSSDNGQTKLLTPSYFRPTATVQNLDPANPIWKDPSPASKYKVLRPRPIDMYYNTANPSDPKNFPLPGDAGGDVKQVPGADYYVGGVPMKNDSFWMDMGYPVQTTRSGRKFKPLFAWAVVDLDGRLNINAAGNVVSGNEGSLNTRQHASNQGLGRHEINLSKVLKADSPSNPVEWRNLFFGNSALVPPVYGRYARDFQPGRGIGVGSDLYPDPYATVGDLPRSTLFPLDFDAVDDGQANRPPSTHYNMPLTQFMSFPSFGTSYDNYKPGSNGDPLRFHPLVYQILRRIPDDTVLSNDNMYHLLAGDYRKSFLNSLIPQNLAGAGNPALGKKIRQMVTTSSYDLDAPGAPPFVTDPLSGGYTMNPPAMGVDAYPKATATFTTPASSALGSQSPFGDYKVGDGRANLLTKLSLNRKFVSYRDPSTFLVTPSQSLSALMDRQQFAQDIFDRLVKATGAVPVALLTQSAGATQQHYDATRYLAQLAANIVDYLDDDDFMTTFQWNPSPDPALDPPQPGSAAGWVYGTEIPKVVLSEAYAEIRNDPADPGPTNPLVLGAQNAYKLSFWIELHNPMPPTPGLIDPSTGQEKTAELLQRADPSNPTAQVPVYQIQIAEQLAGFTPVDLRGNGNTDGQLPSKNVLKVLEVGPITPSNSPAVDYKVILPQPSPAPNSTPAGNQGFYVVGGEVDVEGGANFNPTVKQSNMPQGNGVTNGLTRDLKPSGTTIPKPQHTILLRRLACPQLPPQPVATLPLYNPYVTVDYLSNVPTNDAVKFTEQTSTAIPPPPANNPGYMNPQNRRSLSRPQPYAAAMASPTTMGVGAATDPTHTFFYHNGSSSTPAYDWLVHLNRTPTNVFEILNVSGYKPHELTQQFNVSGQVNKHLAPWAVQDARIYRALEFFTVGDRSPFAGTNGRIPGKININTAFDGEIFDALIDAQQSNFFTSAAVMDVWQNNGPNSVKQRKQGVMNSTIATNDRPFWPLGAPIATGDPQYPVTGGSMGLSESIAGGTFTPQQASLQAPFNSQPAPPFITNELLNKISGNITTRSNTFAVFLTVGFFEVMDDSAKPVRLGAEIKTSNGKAIRHQMFAIVDRTNLAFDTSAGPAGALKQAPNPPVFMSAIEALPKGTTSATVTIQGGQIPSDYDGNTPVTIGQRVFIGMGTSQEMATVTNLQITKGQMTLQFAAGGSQFSHPGGSMICTAQPGNPGPQGPIDYSSQQYKAVVPYTFIIQ